MDDRPKIYIVTAINEKRYLAHNPTSTRPWGWFSTKERALESCERSASWYCEHGYYDHLVVEEFREAYDYGRDPVWYRVDFNEETQEHTPVRLEEPPEWAKLACGWGLG
jgi:hypothetical protein